MSWKSRQKRSANIKLSSSGSVCFTGWTGLWEIMIQQNKQQDKLTLIYGYFNLETLNISPTKSTVWTFSVILEWSHFSCSWSGSDSSSLEQIKNPDHESTPWQRFSSQTHVTPVSSCSEVSVCWRPGRPAEVKPGLCVIYSYQCNRRATLPEWQEHHSWYVQCHHAAGLRADSWHQRQLQVLPRKSL